LEIKNKDNNNNNNNNKILDSLCLPVQLFGIVFNTMSGMVLRTVRLPEQGYQG
jgi:hypothetical protein